jgi:hypothetical protein
MVIARSLVYKAIKPQPDLKVLNWLQTNNPLLDSLPVVASITHQTTLVTRNTKEVSMFNLETVNPWNLSG